MELPAKQADHGRDGVLFIIEAHAESSRLYDRCDAPSAHLYALYALLLLGNALTLDESRLRWLPSACRPPDWRLSGANREKHSICGHRSLVPSRFCDCI